MLEQRDEVGRAGAVTVLALALTALIETVRVPCLGHDRWLQLAAGSYGLSLLHVAKDLAPSVLFLPAFALLDAWQRGGYRGLGSARRNLRLCALLAATLKLTVLGSVLGAAYEKLVLYPDFGRFAPAAVAFVALFAGLALAIVPSGTTTPARAPAVRAVLRTALPTLALLGAGAFYAMDIALYGREYPTLHVSLLQLAHLLLSIGLWLAARWLRAPRPLAPRTRLAAWAMVAAALALFTQVTTASAVADRAYPYWSAHTTLGQSQAVLRPYSEPKTSGRFPPIAEARALALFRAHAGLPELPADFDLLHYNVLLLQSEATRFDQTSLFEHGPPTTPELRALGARGAYSFTRAYSPASGTFQSTAALYGMSYPSQLDLEIWPKPWHGRYRDRHPVPAELFADAGYRTFWVGHNKDNTFTKHVLGFERGFLTRRLLGVEESSSATADEQLATSAITELRAAGRARFFGWVFFVSPHNGYQAHYPDWPDATPLDLYRQEVRYLDEQIARVMRELEALDLLSSTIVIYTGDHGEEFRDHGALWHGNSTYTELINVPLLVWLPGVRGATLTQPTSTMYLFPWLLQHGTAAMRAAATGRLREHIGPMLEATGGAVVSEVISAEIMTSALVYPTRKFNFAFNSGLHQAFRVDRDRLEHHDLYEFDPALTSEAETRIGAYRALRADLRAFELRRNGDALSPP